MELSFFALLGFIVGSFISASSYRIPLGISFVKGRSMCPSCKGKIAWYDNIPVLSYFLLKGKCRLCREKISLRYLAIELFSGIMFFFFYLVFGENIYRLLFNLFVFVLVLNIVIIDLEHKIIPDGLVYVGIVVSFLNLLFLDGVYIFSQLFWAFLLSSFMLFLHLITKGKGMGLGDVKLTLFMALFLGFPLSIFWLFASFILGSVVGVFLILFKKARFGKPIPFGPFMGMSFFVFMLLGKEILRWINYFF